MRLFVAVELPDEVRDRLRAVQEQLRPIPLSIRWVKPGALHLTLKFIGEVGADRIEGIRDALARSAPGAARFHLEARGVGTFPEHGRPRVIWIGLEGDIEAAVALARRIDAALHAIGYPAEQRDFSPHLTLGRVRGGGGGDWRSFLRDVTACEGGGFEVSGFVLFESRLAAAGATYHPVARYALREDAP
jgi:2'-5' RNA ligase